MGKESAVYGETKRSFTRAFARQKKVLLVDEDPQFQDYFQDIYNQIDYNVDVCNDGYEALRCAKVTNPDVIVMDVNLKSIDGYKLCRKFKEDSYTKSIPLIILTANTRTNDKIKGLECGADDYILKPFSIRELEARMRAVMRSYY
ncbi:MAG: response regulator transcription factor [bacterium]